MTWDRPAQLDLRVLWAHRVQWVLPDPQEATVSEDLEVHPVNQVVMAFRERMANRDHLDHPDQLDLLDLWE